jgi:alpha-glucosidase
MQFTLPGAVYIYNGDELGLPNVDLPDSALQDPVWVRSGGADRGRDGERVPLPWGGESAPYDFTTGPSTWLPMPPDWAGLTVAAQAADPSSTLSFYREALTLRRKSTALRDGEFAWRTAPPGCLSYTRAGEFTVLLNGGSSSVALPAGELLLASGPLPAILPGQLPPDTAVLMRTSDDT